MQLHGAGQRLPSVGDEQCRADLRQVLADRLRQPAERFRADRYVEAPPIPLLGRHGARTRGGHAPERLHLALPLAGEVERVVVARGEPRLIRGDRSGSGPVGAGWLGQRPEQRGIGRNGRDRLDHRLVPVVRCLLVLSIRQVRMLAARAAQPRRELRGIRYGDQPEIGVGDDRQQAAHVALRGGAAIEVEDIGRRRVMCPGDGHQQPVDAAGAGLRTRIRPGVRPELRIRQPGQAQDARPVVEPILPVCGVKTHSDARDGESWQVRRRA